VEAVVKATTALTVARSTAERASSALTADLVVVQGRLYYKRGKGKKAVLEPVDLDVHVNPLSIALGGAVGVVGLGVGLWMLGLGARVLTPKERDHIEAQAGYWEVFADYLDAYAKWLDIGQGGPGDPAALAACRAGCHSPDCFERCNERFGPRGPDAAPVQPPVPEGVDPLALTVPGTSSEYRQEARGLRKAASGLRRRLLAPFAVENRPRGLFATRAVGESAPTDFWDYLWRAITPWQD